MSTLILNERQSDIVASCDGSLEVRDTTGRLIGTLLRAPEDQSDEPAELKPEVAQELIRRMSQENIRWSTTEEVLQRLGKRDAL